VVKDVSMCAWDVKCFCGGLQQKGRLWRSDIRSFLQARLSVWSVLMTSASSRIERSGINQVLTPIEIYHYWLQR